VVRRGLDFRARSRRLFHAVGDEFAEQRQARFRQVPIHHSNLLGVEPDEAVAAFERMIEKREFVVARESRELER
jgi:hypothetical protein